VCPLVVVGMITPTANKLLLEIRTTIEEGRLFHLARIMPDASKDIISISRHITDHQFGSAGNSVLEIIDGAQQRFNSSTHAPAADPALPNSPLPMDMISKMITARLGRGRPPSSNLDQGAILQRSA